jgi:hypothetical protein
MQTEHHFQFAVIKRITVGNGLPPQIMPVIKYVMCAKLKLALMDNLRHTKTQANARKIQDIPQQTMPETIPEKMYVMGVNMLVTAKMDITPPKHCVKTVDIAAAR